MNGRGPFCRRNTSARPAGDRAAELHDALVAFPPKTNAVQFGGEWEFVGKKQKHRDPGDARRGDGWDRVALGPETRLVVGPRTAEATRALVRGSRRRTCPRVMRLMTSDEYPVCAKATRDAYGRVAVPPRTGRPGRPRKPRTVAHRR